jgi:single-strand DNA-binding protein
MADSTVTIAGNLTREPELRFTNGGRATASMGVACSRRYQVNGEWQEQTSFLNVVAWGELAEHVAQSLAKGARVIVTGRLEQRQYEAKDGSGQRSVVEIVADDIGPSLRYATAQVERVQRQTTEGQAAGYQAPPARGTDSQYTDEESF